MGLFIKRVVHTTIKKKRAPNFYSANRNVRNIGNFKFQKCFYNCKAYKHDNKGDVNGTNKQEINVIFILFNILFHDAPYYFA